MHNLLRLQHAAGNQAVARLLSKRGAVVQRAGDDMAATLQGRAQQQIEAAKADQGAKADAAGQSGEQPTPPSPEQVAAEKAKQRRAISGTVAVPDTAGAKSQATGAAGAVKAEAAQPPTPVAQGKSTPDGAAGGGDGGASGSAGEAAQAASRAEQAAALAATEAPPDAPAVIERPPVLETLDAGGRHIPADPVIEASVSGLAGRLQLLRSGTHQVRAAAAAERAQGHQLEGLIHAGRSGVADAQAGITALRGHSAHRRGVVEQAKGALEVSKQKAETVASGAPQVSAKSDEGSEKSTPMATESTSLAAENAGHTPEDGEAAGKSAEQGSKLTKVSSDMRSIDSTISQTKARAEQLAGEAAQAKQTNTATQGRIAEAEQAITQTETKTEQLTGQNEAARARLDGMAGEPAAHRAAANELDASGEAMHVASTQLEARLLAAQQTYIGGMAAMPAPVPARRRGSVQRAGYGDRTTYDPAHAVTSTLPPWLTGEDPQNAVAAAQHKAREDARRAAEIAEIEKEAGGHFEQLSASQKMSIALRLSGRNLWKDIGETNLPKFGLTILRGFIDPRVSLMGIVHGVGQIATGVANLFSAEQWQKDPLGNALKSSADIATGVTIILGSIAGLAVAIGIILTAIAIVGSIFSFGAVGAALAPVIVFCGTVASTVGPWALWAAGIALVLHALVFIKNLIDAATARTATELQQNSDQMTEDAKNAGNMALQIGMAKAMELGGKLLAGRGGGGGGGTGEAAPATGAPEAVPAGAAGPEPVPTGAAGEGSPVESGAAPESVTPAAESQPVELPRGPVANDNAIPLGEAPADLPRGPVANDNALPGREAAAMTADGTLPSAEGPPPPELRVIEGGGGSNDAPRAMAGEGEGVRPPNTSEPTPTVEPGSETKTSTTTPTEPAGVAERPTTEPAQGERTQAGEQETQPPGERTNESPTRVEPESFIQGDRLVNADKAQLDPRKITEYALNPDHPVGGNKARVFEAATGFNKSNASQLIEQLQAGVAENKPILGKVDVHGARFTVDIPVTGPAGSATVRTGWIYDPGSRIPRMTTAYVK